MSPSQRKTLCPVTRRRVGDWGDRRDSGDTGFNVLGEDHLEVDEDISLDSAILKDLLSTKPLVLTRKTNPLAAQKKNVDLTEQPDWDF